MEILLAVAAKIAEYTVAPIARPVGYLFSYKDNFNKLDDQVEKLKVARTTIIDLVEAERRSGNEILANVLDWQSKGDKITEEAKKLDEDPRRARVGCSKWPCPNLWWRYQLSKKAKRVGKDVADLEGKCTFDRIGYRPAICGVGSISSAERFVTLGSRMTILQEIMGALADPTVNKIGVYGLGGVGKSTLMEQLAAKAKVEKLFDTVVKADVTKTPDKTPDLKKIQQEIAGQLELPLTDETRRCRSLRLRERIKKEKSILIILDDIWETIELEAVGIVCPAKNNSSKEGNLSGNDHVVCKVLLISQNQDVLHRMGIQKDFRVELLSEEEKWCLFEVKAGEVVKDPSMRRIAVEVSRKCLGLPVIVFPLANSLNNRDIHAWKYVLDSLERVGNKKLCQITHSALELSIGALGNDEVKTLFLLCGVLGQRIRVEYLLKCVMGLDIFKCIRTLEDARSRLYHMIGSLKASCLLLEGDTTVEVRMHDIIRDVAVSIASENNSFMIKEKTELNEWPEREFLESYSQILLDCCHIHKLRERLDCPELKLLYLYSANSSLGIPDSFFEGMGNLVMLDLTGVSLSSLPTSFGSLINLKTLCLDVCALGDMATIVPLKNLEILSFYQSSMTKLPSEIGQLTNLRMLDLSNSEIKVIPPNIISNLTKLEELYMGNTFIEWEAEDSTRQNKNATLAELGQLPCLTALNLQIQEAGIWPEDLMFENLERYKIFIGDVWEWVGNYKTSKILKLKLCTSIHLEYGIKTLINSAEELYLDQISGISNDLYQLNGEGFPLLKQLHIQNNEKIQHIVNSLEWNQDDSFPNLETLVLRNLYNLEMICPGQLAVNSFSKLRVIKVESCYQLAYLFSNSMINIFRELLEIDVSKCNSMKRIVLVESGTTTDKIEFCRLCSLTLYNLPALDGFYSDDLTTYTPLPFFTTQVVFPNLETLKLSSINLNKIWVDDVAHSFQNLTNLIVEDCGELKYLFSSSMVRSLLNLKRLEISKCHMMKEIIDTKEESNSGFELEEVQFSKLETIIINDMKNLEQVWHRQFDKLRTMEVKNCEKVVLVFPSHLQRKLHHLETLMVTDCGSVEGIFELNANETCSEEKLALLKLTLIQLPKLKQIWSRDPEGILCYHNLQVVHVEGCHNLEHLFPLSIAKNLRQVEEIIIKEAQGMKEIVANREGPLDGIDIFEFNQLSSLVLWNLLKVERFYAGNHTLYCPSLKEAFVFNCPKLSLVKTQSTSNQGPTPNDQLHVLKQQSLFTAEKLKNLEQLTLNSKDASVLLQGQSSGSHFRKLKLLRLYDFDVEEATFPNRFLKSVPSLEWLIVDYSSLDELFRDKAFPADEGPIKVSTRLKKLTLFELHGLQHICKQGSKIDPILEVIESIILKQCADLISFVPSSNSFSHLTYLEVENCNKLIYLITHPTATSLVKLKVMKIKDCNSLEEIVTAKGDETEDNSSFCNLETLELNRLPQLTRFCSSKGNMKLQMLEEVVVRQCPRMQVFSEGDTSTPGLRKVQIGDDQEPCWDGNMNGTIKKMFTEMVSFHSFQHLNLFEYPELKDFWYGRLQHKMFRNLKHLKVEKCNFLSDVLFSSNLLKVLQRLEELEVRDCDSLEAVFDVAGMNDNRTLVKETSQLKKLTLFNVPNLKHIWKNSSHEILSFGNLCVVKVVECRSLINLFSVSFCQNLRQLEELNIESCEVEEIVAMDEGLEEHCFDFPQLTVLKLWSLTKLKSFYPGRHSLNCPLLKTLSVYHCEGLHIFEFDYSNFQQPHHLGGVDIPIRKAFFSVEKVCPDLELLTLNEKDAMMIKNGHYPAGLFSKVDFLSLQCFHQTPATFPNDFLQTFVNLVTLQLRCSAFEVLFPSEEIGHNSTAISMRIRNLRLFDLHELKYIWHKDSQWDAFDLKLEHLAVVGCSSLESLVPSSMSLKNLTDLSVYDCKGLTYLITFSTAETLLQLKSLTINNCEMMEDVIRTEEEAEGKIIFENLEYLQLTSLSSLKRFSCGKQDFIFPSLVRFIITGCPNMKIFSPGNIVAPILRAVEVENRKKRWKEDLNATIQHCL